MKTWARLDGNVVVETFNYPTNPKPLFDPSWTWVECPADTKQHAVLNGDVFENPEEPEPVDPPTPIEAARASKIAAINAKVEAVLSGGFTVPAEASTALGGKVLQTRDADDRINWLVSQASYSTAVAAGQGEAMGANFRTIDNQSITVSYAEGLNALLAMAAWGAAAMDNSWALKDAALTAQDQAALDAVDVEAGWP